LCLIFVFKTDNSLTVHYLITAFAVLFFYFWCKTVVHMKVMQFVLVIKSCFADDQSCRAKLHTWLEDWSNWLCMSTSFTFE